jgi:Zn-dependent protease
VFLLEPEQTPYDLRFRLFRTDVRVHPMFWVLSAFLGWPLLRELGPVYLLVWVACVFFSILVHEFGHIAAGRYFGSPGYIVLFSFGGLAVGSSNLNRRWQRIIVSLAGPGAQFLLFGLVWLAWRGYVTYLLGQQVSFEASMPILATLGMLWQINLFWPLLNLLPIWPLDGGKISREICQASSRDNGTVISLGISGVLAGILAVHCLMTETVRRPLIPFLWWLGGFFMAIFFAMFCVQSFVEMQQEKQRRRSWDDDYLPWER